MTADVDIINASSFCSQRSNGEPSQGAPLAPGWWGAEQSRRFEIKFVVKRAEQPSFLCLCRVNVAQAWPTNKVEENTTQRVYVHNKSLQQTIVVTNDLVSVSVFKI